MRGLMRGLRAAALSAGLVMLVCGCNGKPPNGGTERSGAPPASYEEAAQRAVDYLTGHQNEDGGFGNYEGHPASSVGVTSLAAYALMRSPSRPTEDSSPELKRAIEYILERVQPSGAITVPGQGMDNYNTSAAVMALKQTGNPAHDLVLERARAFLLGLQLDEGEGRTRDDPFYGGISYAPGGAASDGSNTSMWMDAMEELGLEPGDEATRRVELWDWTPLSTSAGIRTIRCKHWKPFTNS